ncbi:muconate cycloisomerase I, MLE [Teratosphaeria nubilosa]|uniref:Muconate cycloisomerase I, MLE n=1 Tax=Teratosphaeria nubilosa TaxID=161662 RepID=A0A6G1KZH1_9PEZI|nr:muconate cycloisomerase I, MLE [Teratosphaeria nubilosa]
MDFIVGSFNHDLYTLHFQPPSTLTILRSHPSIGGHSWLALSHTKTHLYCTAWTSPHPSIAAYKISSSGRQLDFLNAVRVKATSGYVCVSTTHIYSAGGPTGEVFRLNPDGSIGDLVQELNFVDLEVVNQSEKRGDVPHGDFGGLRHGAHSVDLSPDGKNLYIADIGRNCIWTYTINPSPSTSELRLNIPPGSSSATASPHENQTPHLTLGSKHISPRPHDGPRHTWPHPNGKILYSLQEHSSMVDLFTVSPDGVTLAHLTGVKIIPEDKDPKNYWADEVRLSAAGPDKTHPRYMYASTRGLKAETKGYVAVFPLHSDGTLQSETALHIWETPTSGGIANAIEPAPASVEEAGAVEYLAMTDSEEGWVFILNFDTEKGRIAEVARVNLGKTDAGEVVKAATAVWL